MGKSLERGALPSYGTLDERQTLSELTLNHGSFPFATNQQFINIYDYEPEKQNNFEALTSEGDCGPSSHKKGDSTPTLTSRGGPTSSATLRDMKENFG